MTKIKDLTGQRFGYLKVVKFFGTNNRRQAFWVCQCDCGNIKSISSNHLTRKLYSVKSCGCKKYEQRVLGNESAKNNLYCSYKWGAKDRNYKFELTKDEFYIITSSNCYYCGNPPSMISKSTHREDVYIHNGVDRIDNAKGYTIENSVPCCKRCNIGKNDMDFYDFIEWARDIYKNFYKDELETSI